ncbi:phosphate ABC transporter permease subunit PstC [Bailinhaonella thermotolerans]|uniref:Phosphate transport system permease protein n=1 Tax=Bailinhaonella thermotolerans TaxID=1070861 RepID=A0A3A4AAS7_9ACTN|nr:phosphate ABC transporter permease subunit PstC [Bailinhaonella thermotolerans]RJL25199.1 phosphate ABC transporter permease subunit PstC [Bailinhaonella thermotolerans]
MASAGRGVTAPGNSLGRSRPRYGETAVKVLLLAAALVSIATTVGIVGALIEPTIKFFGEVSVFEFFASTDWAPLFSPPAFGVIPVVTNTLIITLIAILVAVPLGLAAAIYLSEYATARVRKALKPILEVLAGIPTVALGFFALTLVSPFVRSWWPFPMEAKNGLVAGLIVGMMIIPIVASLSEDAMSAVPGGLREGAYALGSSRMIVSLRVVFPAALSGIIAAVILAISRAAGETMIVVIAAGSNPTFTVNPGKEMPTMASFIAQAGSGDLPVGSIAYDTIFAVGSLLFALTFAMNFISARFVRRFREVYE